MKKRAHHWEDTVQGASRDECVLDALGDAPSKPKQAKQQQEEPPQQQQQQKQNRGIPSDPPGWERIVRKKRDEHRLTQQRLAWLEQTFGKFRRPNTTEFLKQPKAQFYLHDLDYCNEVPNRKFSDPVVRLCCLTEQGNSVCVRVHGVSAYFYVKPNRALQHRLDTLPEKQVLEEFAAWLNKQTKQHVGVHDTPPEDCVVGMERLQRSHYYGFERDKITVLLVRMASPRLVVPARNALWALRRKIRPETMAEKIAGWSMEDVVADDEADRSEDDMMQDDEEIHWESGLEADALRTDPFELFEADVLFTLRFLIDTRMAGCAWFEAAWDKLQLVPHEKRHSRLQLEYDMNMQDLVSLPDKDTVPREIRILAVDYEMGGRRGHFPQAELDPILCGSFMLFRVEDGIKPIVACSIFVGDSDATQFKGLPEGTPLIDVQCGRGHPAPNGRWNREAEAEMLLIIQWLEVNIFQHDYFGGYNSRNFDKRYELQRSDALGISNTMRRCGKLHDEIAIVNLKTFSSKAQNTRTDAEIRQWGIMDFDAMHILRRDGKRFRR